MGGEGGGEAFCVGGLGRVDGRGGLWWGRGLGWGLVGGLWWDWGLEELVWLWFLRHFGGGGVVCGMRLWGWGVGEVVWFGGVGGRGGVGLGGVLGMVF